jgi:malate dehydrogenase (oxaloacetate-decarboxylating)(NADP+)
MPEAEELANIAEAAAGAARKLGLEPRVAMTSYSTFGYPESERSDNLRDAVKILEGRGVDFEFDGEMAADVALSREAMETYPFCRLSGPANVLVMPARHSASISTKMLRELGGSTLIGPILVGMESPVQLCAMGSGVGDIVNMAVFAAGEF